MATAIKYESALPALVQSLIGSKTTQTSTGAGAGADVDPLRQVFGQQMASSTPEGMAAMLTELFTNGAKQVPVLTQAFANSAGARTSNNSGLNLALGELNKTLAGQAATMAMEQQGRTAQTANGIAQGTRGSAPVTQTQKQGMGDPTTALVASLLGTGLNFADKKGLFKGIFGTDAPVGANLDFSNGFGSSGGVLDAASLTGGYDSYDFQNVPELGGGGVDFGMFGGEDIGGFADLAGAGLGELASGLGEAAGGIPFDMTGFDFGSIEEPLGEVAGGFGDFIDFGSFFADGGLVNVKDVKAKQAAMAKKMQGRARGYADGGMVTDVTSVVRNKNNMGGPVMRQGTGSVNFTPEQLAVIMSGTGAGGAGASRTGATGRSRNLMPGGFESDSASGQSADFGSAVSDSTGGASALGGSLMGAIGGPVGMALAMALGLTSMQGLAAKALASKALDATGFGTSDLDAQAAAESAAGNDALSGFLALNDGFGTMGNSGAASGATAEGSVGDLGAGAGDMGGFGAGGFGGDGMGGDGGGGLGGGSYRHGGEVNGPGTGTSDSIPARLSDGEFVVSADVVETLGADFFEKLQQQFHTPAAQQRRAA